MLTARRPRRIAILLAFLTITGALTIAQQGVGAAASTDKCGSKNLARDGWVKTKKSPPRLYLATGMNEDANYTKQNPYEIKKSGGSLGSMELYWHAATKRNCLVVNRTGDAKGHRDYVGAAIVGSTGQQRSVAREFKHYAWVTAYSPGCATVMGVVAHGDKNYANWFKQC